MPKKKPKSLRFIAINERPPSSDLDPSFWVPIAGNSCYLTWRGVPIQKEPFQMVSTQELIQELAPRTIIEFGSYKGGSALWLADMQQLFVQSGQVLSVDRDLSRLDEKAKSDRRIRFLEGDVNHIEQIFSKGTLENLPRPLLLIEDTHVNLTGILDYCHQYILREGDYIIVEDTNPDYYHACAKVRSKKSQNSNLNNKLVILTEWLYNHIPYYQVDTKYLDLFGVKNISKNWNSVLRRSNKG